MAMGVSAHGSPFKPCSASSFIWLSPSPFRRSPSYAFWAPSKSFDRREMHSLQSGDGPHSHSCSSHFLVKIDVLATGRNSCARSDRINSHLQKNFTYKDKVVTLTYYNGQSVEEEKKQNIRPHIDDPSEKGVDAVTPFRHSACSSVSKPRQSDYLEIMSKRYWHEESLIMKALRLKQEVTFNSVLGMVTAEILQCGNIIRNEKVEFEGLQDGSEKLSPRPCLNVNGHASGVTLSSNEVSVRGYSVDVRANKSRSKEFPNSLSRNVGLTLPQTARPVQHSESLTKKLPDKYKDTPPERAIERDIVDHKFSATDRSVKSAIEQKHSRKECSPVNAIGWGTFDGKSSIKDGLVDNSTGQKYSLECSARVLEQHEKLTRNSARVLEQHEKLTRIYDKVLVVDNISMAKKVVEMLTQKYRDLVHACDTEVAKIDVKQETPVGHGEIICFSIYSGPQADFGNGKSCVWVDVLDGGRHLLMEFAPFFEDPCIKKVWHNYSFDSHVIENYGFQVSGFHADTIHLARLWDSSRRTDGGYSLEALTSDPRVMSGAPKREKGATTGAQEKGIEATSRAPIKEKQATPGAQSSTDWELVSGKISMKTIFGKKKIKKDGSEGKLINVAPVEELQRGERIPWICYSALDSISTLMLYDSLKAKLMSMEWVLDGVHRGTMYDFYEEYWLPFGALLVEMESEGMLVDRAYLSVIEKVATREQQVAAGRFRNWASKYCPDAIYMNVGSDTQLRQLFFGDMMNRKNENESLPRTRTFKVPNVDKVIEEGKKAASKFRNITLHKIVDGMQAEIFTASGWPSLCGDALKTFAGKVSAQDYGSVDDSYDFDSDVSIEIPSDGMSDEVAERRSVPSVGEKDTSAYGTAYAAFGGGKEGMEACHAIASLCEVCSIDSLISNFILPLQGCHISGANGRIHCSLNINTETGRLSARRPNLQNQPALEKDRYKIRQAFIAEPGNSLIVADYGQLELRILAHLANCKSMLDAFKAGGDFHSRTAMNMYPHVREAVEEKRVLLEWYPQPGEEKPPVPLLKDAFASERRKAKMLNFSIAYGKTPVGLARDWKVSVRDAKETVKLWYKERQEVLRWQEQRKEEARTKQCVYTLLGRARRFPSMESASAFQKGHIERAAINTPVQGSAADVAMCAMLEISRNGRLKDLGWRLLLQVHDEVILEGPSESAEVAKAIVVECMTKPFYGTNFLKVDLSVDAKCALNWYAAK